MMSDPRFEALDQIDFLRKDCNTLLSDMFAICNPDANGEFPAAFRMVATPFLYAIWERCFSTSFAIMAKLVRETRSTPATMPVHQAALWLQKEPFFKSFIDKIQRRPPDSDTEVNKKAISQSAYKTLVTFVSTLLDWHSRANQSSTDDGELVMTFSNINTAVVDLNADAIGLSNLPEYKDFRDKIGRLEDLVGRRNDIAHGTLAKPPGPREFDELNKLVTEVLIKEYCEVVQTWIAHRK